MSVATVVDTMFHSRIVDFPKMTNLKVLFFSPDHKYAMIVGCYR